MSMPKKVRFTKPVCCLSCFPELMVLMLQSSPAGFLKGSQENSLWGPLLLPLKSVAELPMAFIGSGQCSVVDGEGARLPVF